MTGRITPRLQPMFGARFYDVKSARLFATKRGYIISKDKPNKMVLDKEKIILCRVKGTYLYEWRKS
jgi:hypothetical protein